MCEAIKKRILEIESRLELIKSTREQELLRPYDTRSYQVINFLNREDYTYNILLSEIKKIVKLYEKDV